MKQIEQIEHTLHNWTDPKRGHTFWGLTGVCILAFALLWLKHGNLLSHANEQMFAPALDGYKNYMTTAWHVRHDSSSTHYDGMNYPYGEHVLFTDNQPIIAAGLRWYDRHISDIDGQVIGIINWLQVLSMIFGVAIFYLLMRKLHLPVVYAGIVSLCVIFLSPQYGRFDVHFGLSHTWVIPLLLFWLCRYEERVSKRYQSLHIGILIWFASQIHFYYFGLSAIFLSFYTIYQLWVFPNWKNIRSRLSHLVVMVALPLTALNFWLHWSDFAGDRPSQPYGFNTYLGEWQGVFLPYPLSPLYKFIDGMVKIPEVNGESIAYFGLVVGLFTLYAWLKRFHYFDTSWNAMAHYRVHKHYLRGIFFAGTCVLLFSFGVPFALPGMEWALDYLGPLRQFRGLARFTWAYYYVCSALAFYVIWHKGIRWRSFRGAETPWPGRLFIGAFVALVGYEAIQFQVSKTHRFIPNLANRAQFTEEKAHWLDKVDFNQFQALLSLKYHHIGSEHIWMEPDPPMFRKIQATAFHTGIPDMDVNLSRTSLQQMLRSVQLVKAPFQKPKILEDLPNGKPIALMVEPAHWEGIQVEYAHLLRKAEIVYEHPKMKIFRLYPDSLAAAQQLCSSEILAEMNATTLSKNGEWNTSDPSKAFDYEAFENGNERMQVFKGAGALTAKMCDTTLLLNKNYTKGRYVLNFWVYALQDQALNHRLSIELDGKTLLLDGTLINRHLVGIANSWALIEIPFEIEAPASTTRIWLHNKEVQQTGTIDELMVRPETLTLYRKQRDWVSKNNWLYAL